MTSPEVPKSGIAASRPARACGEALSAALHSYLGSGEAACGVTVRQATLGDLEGLLHVSGQCFDYNPIRPADFRYLLQRAHAVVLVMCAPLTGAVVAFTIWEFNQRTAVLYANATGVLVEWRNRGLGRFAMRLRHHVAALLGYRWARTHIAVDNHASLHLALSEGYQEIARLPDWYDNGQAAVALRRRIERIEAPAQGQHLAEPPDC